MTTGMVILTILKVIGWILLALLALIVLILLVLLLVPVRYRVTAHITRSISELDIDAGVHWLLRLISGGYRYRDGESGTRLRIAFKRILPAKDDEPAKEDKPDKKESVAEKASEKSKPEIVSTVTAPETPADEDKKEDPPHLTVVKGEDTEHTEKERTGKEKKRKRRKKEEKKSKLPLIDRITEIIEEVRFAKEDIVAFLTDPVHQKVLKLLKKRFVKFAKKLLPSRLEITGDVGFDDPYNTVLAMSMASAVYPFVDKAVFPDFDFEREIIDLDALISGKLRLGSLVSMILPILININTWRTIKDAKRLKTKLDRSVKIIKEGGQAA